MKLFINFLLAFFWVSCSNTSTTSKNSLHGGKITEAIFDKFRYLKNDLFIDNTGNIGIRVVDRSDPQNVKVKYLTSLWYANPVDSVNGGQMEMKDFIDTSTFEKLSGTYFRDKDHVYVYNQMADGGTFVVMRSVDLKTYRVLGTDYLKDKSHVYFGSKAIQGADLESFESFPKMQEGDTIWTYAKDKQRTYYFGRPIARQ